MTYVKPELVELVHASQATQSGNYDDRTGDKVSWIIEIWLETTSSGAAYEADE